MVSRVAKRAITWPARRLPSLARNGFAAQQNSPRPATSILPPTNRDEMLGDQGGEPHALRGVGMLAARA